MPKWTAGTSGNPKGRPRKEKSLTAALEARATKQADEIAQAALDLALGHWVEEKDGKGQRRVYFVSPNIAAIAFVFDRIDGKVAAKLDIAFVIRRAAEAKGLGPNDPVVLAAIAETEALMREARG